MTKLSHLKQSAQRAKGYTDELISEYTGAVYEAVEEIDTKINQLASTEGRPRLQLVTLSPDQWLGSGPFTQLVTVNGVLSDGARQKIDVTPAPESLSSASESEAYCSGFSANSLTFSCTEKPDTTILFCVSIQEAAL